MFKRMLSGCLLLAAIAAGGVNAADYTWAQTTTTGNYQWDVATNWSPIAVPTTGDNVTFPSLTTGATITINLATPRSLGTITVNGSPGSYVITTSGTGSLDSTGVAINSGNFRVNSTTVLSGSTISIASAARYEVGAAISLANVTVNAGGFLKLFAAPSAAPTAAIAGILEINVNIAAGTSWKMANASTVRNTAAGVTFSPLMALNGTVNFEHANGSWTMAGLISDETTPAGINCSVGGATQLTFSAANNYTGPTTVAGNGWFKITHAQAVATTAVTINTGGRFESAVGGSNLASVVCNPGGILKYQNDPTSLGVAPTAPIAGFLEIGSGGIGFSFNGLVLANGCTVRATQTSVSCNANVTLQGTVTFDSGITGFVFSFTMGGTLSGNANVVVRGGTSTTVTFSGTNSYTGNTTIQNNGWLRVITLGATPNGVVSVQNTGRLEAGVFGKTNLANVVVDAGGFLRLTIANMAGSIVPDVPIAGVLEISVTNAAGLFNLPLASGAVIRNLLTTATYPGSFILNGPVTIDMSLTATALTFTGTFSGTGGLTVSGQANGTTFLQNTNTYTGPTVVNAGTLNISDSAAGLGRLTATSAITVNGSTLSIAESGAPNVDRINDAATITLNGSTFTTAAVATIDHVENFGPLSLAGASTINLTAAGVSPSGDYRASFMSLTRGAGSTLTFNRTASGAENPNLFIGGIADGLSLPWATLGGSPGGYLLTDGVVPVAALAAPFTTASAGDWDTGSTWTGGLTPPEGARVSIGHAVTNSTQAHSVNTLAFTDGGSLTGAFGLTVLGGDIAFSGTGAAPYAVAIPLDCGTGSVTISQSNTVAAATISAPITAPLGLTKLGGGDLALTVAQNIGGPTVIGAGRLLIPSDAALGTTLNGAVTINGATLSVSGTFSTARPVTLGTGGGTIDVAAGQTLTLNAPLGAGANALTKTGAGQLTLTTTSTRSGNTTISAGTVRTEQVDALGTATTGQTLGAATLEIANHTHNRPLALTGGSTLRGVGPNANFSNTATATLAGAITFTTGAGPLDTLRLSGILSATPGSLTITGNIVDLNAVNTFTCASPIASTANLFRLSNGTGLGNVANSVTVNSGTLASSASPVAANPITLNGGTLASVSADITYNGTVAIASPSTISTADALIPVNARHVLILGAVSGSADLTVSGVAGKVVGFFATNNTYSGNITVNPNATLELKPNSGNAIAGNLSSTPATVRLNGGTLRFNNDDNVTFTTTKVVVIDNTNSTLDVTRNSGVPTGKTMTLSAANALTLGAGTVNAVSAGGSYFLNVSTTTTLTASTTLNATTAAVILGPISGAGFTLTKVGAGAVTLAGATTLGGLTANTALLVTGGVTATNLVAVNPGGTITVQNAGRLLGVPVSGILLNGGTLFLNEVGSTGAPIDRIDIGAEIKMNGGTFNLTTDPAVAHLETFGRLNFIGGHNSITATPTATSDAQIVATDCLRSNGATLAFGRVAAGADFGNLKFSTFNGAPTVMGQSLFFANVGLTAAAANTSAVYDTTEGVVAMPTASTFTTAAAGNWEATATWTGGIVPGPTADVIIRHAVVLATAAGVPVDKTVNSLTLDQATAALNNATGAASILTVTSGVVTGASTLSAGATVNSQLQFGAAEGIINNYSTQTLTLNGVIRGTGGLSRGGTGTGTVTLSGSNVYSGLTFLNAGSTTLNTDLAFGNTSRLYLLGGAMSATTRTFSMPVTIGASTTFTTGPVVFTGPISLEGPVTDATLTTNGAVFFSNNISEVGGPHAITKAGGAGLALLGDNTNVTGGITVTAGPLQIGSATAIGTGALTMLGGSIEAILAPRTITNTIVAGADFTFGGGFDINLQGNLDLAGDRIVTVAGATVTVDGLIRNSPLASARRLTKAGAATLRLNSANTFSNGFSWTAGFVQVGHNSAFGPGPLLLNSGSGSFDAVGGPRMLANNVFINGSFTVGGTQALTFASPATLNSGPTITINNTAPTTFAAAITNNGGNVTKAGPGLLVLAGTNTYTNTTTINAGTLRLSGDQAALTASTAITVNAGATFDIDATGTANPNRILDTATLTLNGGTLSMSSPPGVDRIETISGLTLSGGANTIRLTANGSSAGRAQLIVTAATQPTRTAGTLNFERNSDLAGATANLFFTSQPNNAVLPYASVNGGASVYLTAAGLVAAADIAGTTRVSTKNGAWEDPSTWSPNGVPGASDDVVIRHAITLAESSSVAGRDEAARSVTFDAAGTTGIFNLATFTNKITTASITVSGTATPTIAANLDIGAGTESFVQHGGSGLLEVSGTILGTALISKGGAGTVLLSNTNNLNTGGITVLGGKLTVAADGSFGPGTPTFNGGTLLVPASQTLARNLASGTNGGTIEVAAGTLTLSGINALSGTNPFFKSGPGNLRIMVSSNRSGTTTILSGTVRAENNNALGTGGTVIVNSGSIFEIGDNVVFAGPAITLNDGSRIRGIGFSTCSPTPVIALGATVFFDHMPMSASDVFTVNMNGGNAASLVVFDGNGRITSTANNSGYEGTGRIDSGLLQFTSAFGDNNPVPSTLTVNAGGTLVLGNNFPSPVVLNGGTLAVAGADRTLAGALNVAAASTISTQDAVTPGIPRDLNITGRVTGSGPLAVIGFDATKAFRLSNGGNAYSGTITVNAGLLLEGQSGGSLGTASINLLGARLNLRAGGAASFPNAVTVGGTAPSTIDVANLGTGLGHTLTLSSLSLGAQPLIVSGTQTYNLALSGNLALSANATVNTVTANLTVFGQVTGAVTLTKTGPSQFTLKGDNTASGLTTVAAGALVLDGATSALASDVTVNAGAVLQIASNGNGANQAIPDGATVTLNGGGLILSAPTGSRVETIGSLTVANNSTLNVQSGTGAIAQLKAGALNRTGASTLTFTRAFTTGQSNLFIAQGTGSEPADGASLPFITVIDPTLTGPGVYHKPATDSTGGVTAAPVNGGTDTLISIISGNWNTAGTWMRVSDGSVTATPAATDNVIIGAGHAINLNGANRTCNSLTFQPNTGATQVSSITDAAARQLIVISGVVTALENTTVTGLRRDEYNGTGAPGATGGPYFTTFASTSIDTQLNTTGFATAGRGVVWSGYIVPQFTESYLIGFNPDDGARIYLDGRLIIDTWRGQGPGGNVPSAPPYFASVPMVANTRVPLRIEWYNGSGTGAFILSWNSPSQTSGIWTLIPQANLLAGGNTITVNTNVKLDLGAGAAVINNRSSGSLLLNGGITSSGSLEFSGCGGTAVPTANTGATGITGTVTLSSGLLAVGNGQSLGASTVPLTVRGGILTASAAVTLVNNPVTLAGDLTFGNVIPTGTGVAAANALTLTLSGNVTLNGNRTIVAATGNPSVTNVTAMPGLLNDPIITGTILDGSETSMLTKGSTGILTLNSPCAHTGGTTILAGAIRLGADNIIPTNTVLVLGTPLPNTAGPAQHVAYLELNNFNQTLAGAVVNPGATATNAQINNAGAATRNLTFNNSADVTYAGVIGNVTTTTNKVALIKNGTGRLLLTGTISLYNGGSTVNAGTLAAQMFSTTTGSPLGTGLVTVDSAVLEARQVAAGNLTLPNTLLLRGTAKLRGVGVMTANFGVAHNGTTGVNITIDSAPPATVTFETVNPGDVLRIGGNIIGGAAGSTITVVGVTGSTVPEKLNSSRTSIEGLNANTYVGAWIQNSGILNLSKNSSLGDPATPLTVNAGLLSLVTPGVPNAITMNGGYLASANLTQTYGGTLTVGGPATLLLADTIGGGSPTARSLSLTGTIAGSQPLAVIAPNGASTLTLTGTGTTYGGTMTVNVNSTVIAQDAGSLGTGAATVNLAGGLLSVRSDTAANFNAAIACSASSTLNIDRVTPGTGVTHTLRGLILDAPILTITNGNGCDVVFDGPSTLTANATFVSAATPVRINGSIDDVGIASLTKQGAAPLTISGLGSTFEGGLNIQAGTLTVVNTFGSATGTGPLNLSTGTSLLGTGGIDGAVTTFGNALIVPGLAGMGTLTINGPVKVNAGTPSLAVTLNSTVPSNTSLSVSNPQPIDLGAGVCTLNPTLLGVGAGQSFTIIRNTSGSPILGNFAGLPNGSSTVISGRTFTIRYNAGVSGNDVVLFDNVAPVLNAGRLTQRVDEKAALQNLAATDPDEFIGLTYTLVTGAGLNILPPGVTMDSFGVFSGTPDLGTGGFTYTPDVIVTDSMGAFDRKTLSITVRPVVLSVVSANVTEGTPTIVVQASRSGLGTNAISATYTTSNGSALSGSDYTTTANTLNWGINDTATKTITIPIANDTQYELIETFTVTLTGVTTNNASIGAAGTVTILDDDTRPTVSIADASAAETDGLSTLSFTVSLSAISGADTTVRLTSSDGTALAGQDYMAFTNTLFTVPAGAMSTTFDATILGNTFVEPSETFTVTLSSPNGATLGTATATGTITDDDVPPSLDILTFANPSVFGQPIQLNIFTDPVPPHVITPTGTVTIKEGATTLGTANVVGGLATFNIPQANLTIGVHTYTVDYVGGNYSNTSDTFDQTVNQASTSTAVMSSLPTSVFGQNVTFTATVSAVSPGAGTPTGSVDFFDGAALLGSGTLSGGVATYSTAALAAGTHSITAVYGSDTNFLGSTSSALTQTVNKADTTTSLVSAPNPSTFGQSVTFTATVATVAPGVGVATGTVNFFDGATNIGSGAVDGSGVATLSTAALNAGSHSITAVYSNLDGNFNGSTSTLLTQVVNQSATTTALMTSLTPTLFGQNVMFTATVAAVAPGAGVPTGTVTFFDGATNLGTGTLSGGTATLSTSALTVGAHSILATYGGSADFIGSSSSTLTQTVNQASTTTVLASAPNPSTFGQSVTFTATVAAVAPGSGTPTGTVDFFDGATPLGTGTLSGGVATLTTATLAVGGHSTTAVYNGDAGFTGSTSPANLQTVNASDTTTALMSSISPSVFGQSVTFTATVSPVAPGAGTPTGTVTFFDSATSLGTGTLSAGTATLSTSTLAVGGHTITAVYGADASFNASTSAPTTQTVNQASTTTALMSSAQPSVFGQSVTFTATVAAVAPGAGTATGTVSFFDGATLLGTNALSGGSTTLSTSTLAVSGHSITAVYSGDTNFTASTSAILTQTVNQAATTTTLMSGTNPSSTGQSVTFTATVAPVSPGAGTPTGTVSFFDGAAFMGSGVLSGGVATYATSALTTGAHAITAVYGADTNFTGSTSAVLTQNVGQASTTTALMTSLSPTVFGQSVTFTATVSIVAPGTGTASGTVDFFDGAALIGSGTLSGGSTTFSTSSLAVTSHAITAVYNGDTSFIGSTSAVVTQSVIKADTTTVVVSSLSPTVFGQSVTLTATVATVTPGAGTASGTVDFFDGAALLGSGTLSGGVATYSTSALSVAGHPITAVYTADASFNGSTSPGITQTVNQTSTTTALMTSLTPTVFGQSVTFTATVAAGAPGAGTPSGTVTFFDGAANLGTGTLTGGIATLSTGGLSVTSHSITAVYAGNASFTGSTSAVVTQTVNQGATTTAVASSSPPSVFGEPVTFTATVAAVAPAAGTATGTVSFFDGATLLGTGTLSGGIATLTTSTLALNAHSITSVYSGDTNFTGSTSTVLTQTVNPAATTTVLVANPTAVPFGDPVTFTATVSANLPSTAIPTGSVTFSDGATVLATVPLSAGVATYTTSTLSAVAHTITADYVPDAEFLASSDSLILSVGAIAPTITWPAPAGIVYGTALGGAQLNASANVPGSFVYTPAAGTVLSAGAGQTLSATFTPADLLNYTVTTVTTTITVAPAPLTITADSLSSVAGSVLPTLTATYAGFVNGDTVSSLDTAAVISTTATASSQPGSYPITVTSAADANYAITFVAGTLTITNTAPAISSGAIAAQPNPAKPNELIAFTAVATDADSHTLAYAWNFGDGSTGSGATPSHAYTTPGLYTATLTVTDGFGGSASASLEITIKIQDNNGDGIVTPMDTDTDGDGFTDNIENALGTDPLNANDTPTGQPLEPLLPLVVTGKQVTLDLAKPHRDAILLTGTLPIPDGFQMSTGPVVLFDIGGEVRTFKLSKKGTSPRGDDKFSLKVKSKRGVAAAQNAPFILKTKRDDLRQSLSENSPLDAGGLPTQMTVVVLFNGRMYTAVLPLTFLSTRQGSVRISK